jgi:hypothetical protein
MNRGEVRVGQSDERIDAVHQSPTWMAAPYPVPIGVGRLVVNPHE